MCNHQNNIIDQFSKQAIPFANIKGHNSSVDSLVQLCKSKKTDKVLDVACGPGIVALEFAKSVNLVTGVDVTPKMIEVAKSTAKAQNVNNVEFSVADFYKLPFEDNSFDSVITRYSFHHLLDTKKALEEMIRVCKVGGKVLVADVAINPNSSKRYDELEKLRDPSHTHALTNGEFENLFQNSSLINQEQIRYYVEIELEAQMKASFPNDGDEVKVRNLIMKDIGLNLIGINVRKVNDLVYYCVPIGAYVGEKA